nr:hypothetical protein [Geomicrobium sp. JCM 19039]
MGGHRRERLQKPGMHMLIRKIVEEKKDELLVYKKTADTEGFIAEMERIITEMRRQAVSAEMLEPLAESDQHVMRDKMHDIHLIYETFESLFTGVYVNAEESIKLLADLVDQSTIARGAIVYIHGFHDFSKQEQIVVHKLFNVASSVKMSLTLPEVPRSGDSPNELDRFFLPAKTYSELTQILQAENLSWGVRQFARGGRFENAGISMLEQFDDQHEAQSSM